MPGEPSYNDLVSKIQIGEGTAFTHALRASAIPYGQVDSTSTATAFTATVPGINVLRDGVCVLLKNGVVTSASGFTINVNGLGAKPSYTNLAAATRDTTIFNIGYTMLFIYDEDRVSGGCWICYRGYDANTNTIGYQIRSNNSTLPAADKGYRYRLWFTSADGSKWVPANKSTSTDSTTSRTPNTTPIDPFGPIVYNSTNGTVNANANLPAATIWQQYTLTIGYSFNEPGGAMAYPAPIYLKCTPQTNGSAVMVELVQALPSTDDGFIYILLGRAYSATAIELIIEHPVFYNDGTGIRAWTGKKPFSGSYTDLTNKPSIPTKTSDLTNDSSFITAAQAPVQSVNGQTGAVTTAEKFVITATAISGTNYYNLDKTFADINVAINQNKYVAIQDVDMTYPYTTTVSQGIVFGATLIATGEGNQLMAVTDGILVVQPDSGTNAMGIAVHSTNLLPTMGDIPSASSTTPLMDGTADVGTGTTWARADHVHPTDTSRQAVLISGTNIKTINNESILGSGNIDTSGGTSSIILEGTYTTPSNLYVQKTPTELYNYLGAGTVVYIKGIYDDEDPYFRQRTNSLYRLNSVEIQGEGNNSFYKASITSHLNVIGDNDTTIVYGYASGQTSDTSVAFTLMPIKTNSANATNSTSKLFLVGATSQTASPATYSNSNVYATNGVLNAKSFSVDASANIIYNSSSKSIDFTFV